jgi:hypothetical protein
VNEPNQEVEARYAVDSPSLLRKIARGLRELHAGFSAPGGGARSKALLLLPDDDGLMVWVRSRPVVPYPAGTAAGKPPAHLVARS